MFHSSKQMVDRLKIWRFVQSTDLSPKPCDGATILSLGKLHTDHLYELSHRAGPNGHIVVASADEQDLDDLAEELWHTPYPQGARIHLHHLADGASVAGLVEDHGRFDLMLLHDGWSGIGAPELPFDNLAGALHPGGQIDIVLTGLFICRHRIRKATDMAARSGLYVFRQWSNHRHHRTLLQKPSDAAEKMVA